jgi:hypothetical protein
MPWETQEIEVEGAKVQVATLDQAGNPIWTDEKGIKTGVDAVRLRAQVSEANKEAGDYRIKVKELEGEHAKFEGIDPEAARQALETVKNFKDKDFVEAGKVEQIKTTAVAEVNKAWEAKYGNLEADYSIKLTDYEGRLGNQDKTIRKLMVRGAFDASQFIKEQVAENYFPEVLYTMFSSHFEVRASDNGGDPIVVATGYNGEEIYSPSNPRQLASPEEAIEVLGKSHPMSKHILRGSQASGSGSQSGQGAGPRNALQQMKDQYATAKAANNVPAMMSLKTQIFAQDPTFTG